MLLLSNLTRNGTVFVWFRFLPFTAELTIAGVSPLDDTDAGSFFTRPPGGVARAFTLGVLLFGGYGSFFRHYVGRNLS